MNRARPHGRAVNYEVKYTVVLLSVCYLYQLD